jgi:hypothetical protein
MRLPRRRGGLTTMREHAKGMPTPYPQAWEYMRCMGRPRIGIEIHRKRTTRESRAWGSRRRPIATPVATRYAVPVATTSRPLAAPTARYGLATAVAVPPLRAMRFHRSCNQSVARSGPSVYPIAGPKFHRFLSCKLGPKGIALAIRSMRRCPRDPYTVPDSVAAGRPRCVSHLMA